MQLAIADAGIEAAEVCVGAFPGSCEVLPPMSIDHRPRRVALRLEGLLDGIWYFATLSLTNGGQVYYLHLVVETGDQAQRIFPRGEMTEVELNNTLEAAFKRIVPGQL